MYDVPVAVKDALRSGMYKKNYRFVVLNDDGTADFTIDNDNLVSESVSIDERMCSGDTLKFGLCEGSSLEFQYFGKANITGRKVQAFIDVEYGEALPSSILMGYFTVQKCSRQASTGIIKASCYNKLMSTYLDADASALIADNIGDEDYSGDMSLYTLLSKTLADYAIESTTEVQTWTYNVNDLHTGSVGLLSPPDRIYAIYDSNGQSTGNYLHIIVGLFSGSYGSDVYYSVGASEQLAHSVTDLWDDFLVGVRLNYYVRKPGTTEIVRLYDYITTKQYDSDFGDSGMDYKGGLFWEHNNPYEKIDVRVGIMDNYINDMRLDFHYTEELDAQLYAPIHLFINNTSSHIDSTTAALYFNDWESNFISQYGGDYAHGYEKILTPMEAYRVTANDFTSNVTLRQLQSAVFESACQFGKLDRVTDLFSGVELNHSRLLPADTLYPSDSLHPDGAQESAFRSQYSKLWADEGNVHKWRYLIITYKGLDENNQEAEFTLQRTVNADGTDDYNMSDNWLFKNLVWTEAQIIEYATAMVAKMQDITWFPFEMWAPGLPYLETGDEIEIPLGENTYSSYILERQLRGIQNLQDTYINGTLDIF